MSKTPALSKPTTHAQTSPLLLVLEDAPSPITAWVVDAQGQGMRICATAETSFAQALAAAEFKPGKVILSPASSQCFCATVATTDLPKRGKERTQTLLYRLEDKLPVDAEQLAANFIEGAGDALGIAVLAERLQAPLNELESSGWEVAAILPWPFLAIPKSSTPIGADAPDAWVVPERDGSVSFIAVKAGQPCGWSHCAAMALPIEAARLQVALGRKPRILCAGTGVPATLQAQLPDLLAGGQDLWPTVAQATKALLAKPAQVPGDLRTGALAHGDHWQRLQTPLTRLWLAACALTLCVLGAALWRSHQQAQVLAACEREQEQMYREVYPNQPLPLGVGSRLDALAASLHDVGPQADDQLVAFKNLLGGLQGDTPACVDEIQLREGAMYIAGQSKSASDTAKLAKQLSGAFTVEAPKTERSQGGQSVQFVLTGKPNKVQGGPR